LAEEFEDRVTFVGVSNNDTVGDGKAYVERFSVPYPVAHSPETWDLFEVPYQPVTIVLDGDHQVETRINGPITYEQLREVLEDVAA